MHNTDELLQQLEEFPVITQRTAQAISYWVRGTRVFFEQGIKEHAKLRDEHTDLQNKFRTLCEEHERPKNEFKFSESQSRKRERKDDDAIEYLTTQICDTNKEVQRNRKHSKIAPKEARENRSTPSISSSLHPVPYSPQYTCFTTPDPPSRYPTFVQGSSNRPLIVEEEEASGSRSSPIVI